MLNKGLGAFLLPLNCSTNGEGWPRLAANDADNGECADRDNGVYLRGNRRVGAKLPRRAALSAVTAE